MSQEAKQSDSAQPGPSRIITNETVLVIWINCVFQQFESNPKSVPWTGTRPLSPEKLDAALAMLRWGSYDLPRLFKVSGKNGPSYSLLRKWRTEKAFKVLVTMLARSYLKGFLDEYLADARFLSEGFKRDGKDNSSRKHEAVSVRWLTRMLGEANDAWGKILYEMAFERLPDLIRKEKAPGIIGHLYMLLLVCHCRWARKLKISPAEGKRYQEAFRDFMVRLGREWSDAMDGFSLDVAKVYAEAFLAYSLLLHSKLTAPIFKHDAAVRDYDLMNVAEQFNWRRSLAQG